MKAMSKKLLALALAVVTVATMSTATTVTANAATKSNVTVKYSNKKVKTASVSKITVSVDGQKASHKVHVHLNGDSAVKFKTAVTVSVKGKKSQKIKNVSKVTYKSSNKAVATVSSKGVITAKKYGKSVITVKSAAKGAKSYKINLEVTRGIKKMTLSSTKPVEMVEGTSTTLTATVEKYKKVKRDVSATSSDKSVVTTKVTAGKNGKSTIKLTAKKAGTAEVTIAPKHGSGKAKTIKVTVTEKPVLYTKVVFADKTAKKVDLKGKVTVDVAKDSKAVESIEKILAAIGGDYTVKIADKTVEVKDGKATQDLSKILDKKSEKTDITVESSKTIAEVLAMVEAMKLTEDVAVDAKFSVVDDKVGAISAVTVKKNGEVAFTFANTAYTAFVKGGELYLVGDHAATLKAITTITNNSAVVKDFEAVTAEVR